MPDVAKRILILGASGMLGNAAMRLFTSCHLYETFGSVRSPASRELFDCECRRHIITGVDAEDAAGLENLFAKVRPDVVINCVGLVKQIGGADDPLRAIPINALLPHRLDALCGLAGARLVHISTDCVFSGSSGMYTETDAPDAKDTYGRSKHLGEVDSIHAVTLRTSIIGHELGSAHGLVNWFLAQQGAVNGFTRAVFSGLPTVELARLIRDHVIPDDRLRGVYHVSASPISKFDLLTIIANVYDKTIFIEPDEKMVIDRSLDSTRFRQATGFRPKPWPELIQSMCDFR